MTEPSDAPPAIEQFADVLDRCLIHSRLEIASILHGLRRDGPLVTAYLDGTADSILTSILAVQAAQDEVFLDCGPDAAVNERALQTGRLRCVAWHERIMIQFAVEEVRKVRFEGRDAFCLPLPASLLRLQRREYYRVSIPRNAALRCVVGPQALAGAASGEVDIVDISCGGIGVILAGEVVDLVVGTRLPACRILLPQASEVTTDMVLKSRYQVALGSGRRHTRSGWEFAEISERDRTPIQRYINKLQREHPGRR